MSPINRTFWTGVDEDIVQQAAEKTSAEWSNHRAGILAGISHSFRTIQMSMSHSHPEVIVVGSPYLCTVAEAVCHESIDVSLAEIS